MVDESWQVLTGQSQQLLVPVDADQLFLLHAEVLPHWQQLAASAADAGFRLQIASAWRGFERQQAIWNGKANGQRPVLDAQGKRCEISMLSEEELLFAMLRWSAIPGCSRHHWGTDLDVFDASAVPPDYQLQLTVAECEQDGPFAALHCWLDGKLAEPGSVFFRPYDQDRGGIAPEPWHLSCRPLARQFDVLLDQQRLLEWIMAQDIALKTSIQKHWDVIFSRYINVAVNALP